MTNHYRLPTGWTWRDVVVQRRLWDISERFYPIATAPGVVAWGRPLEQEVDE